MRYLLAIVVLSLSAGAVYWSVYWATFHSEISLYVGDCVNNQIERDGFKGNHRQAWETYAGMCREQLK